LDRLDLRFQLVGWFTLARLVEMVLDVEWDHTDEEVTF
jgi:hypothetical protein